MQERAWIAETAIEQAIRRGEFDDLPGSGKPLKGLNGVHDPDWWIRQKIEREQLTGLGPPALTLRTENATLDARMDELFREEDVRALLEDFNKRVIEARRQLQGGPPVVTPTRDVEVEISGWRDRRERAARSRRGRPPCRAGPARVDDLAGAPPGAPEQPRTEPCGPRLDPRRHRREHELLDRVEHRRVRQDARVPEPARAQHLDRAGVRRGDEVGRDRQHGAIELVVHEQHAERAGRRCAS